MIYQSTLLYYVKSWTLYQGTTSATAFSEPILIAAHLIVIFKRKITVLSQKYLKYTDRLGSHLPLLLVFPAHHFYFRDLYFIGSTGSGSIIDLKIKLLLLSDLVFIEIMWIILGLGVLSSKLKAYGQLNIFLSIEIFN